MPEALANCRAVRKTLLRSVEEILDRWDGALAAAQPHLQSEHSTEILRDSLPQLLAAIGISLEEATSDNAEPALEDVARAHARLRAELGDFPLGVIIQEYSLFRQELFRHLDRERQTVSSRARQIINRCVDYTIEVSAEEFVGRTRSSTDRLMGERAQLTEKLAFEQARLAAILNQLPVGVSISERPSGRILYHNDEATRLLGHPLLESANIEEYAQYGACHADGTPYRPEEYPIARAIMHGEEVEKEEILYRRGDGEMRWISVNAAPVHVDGEAAPSVAVAAFWDIQEIKTLTRNLAKEKEFAEITLRSIGDGVITVDDRGKVTAMNPAAERLLGWTLSEARGLSLDDMVRLQDDATEQPIPLPVHECIRDNKVMQQRPFVRLHDRQGAQHAVTTMLAPMHANGAGVVGAVAILHDASREWRVWHQMARDASQDPLTGLVNRREFERRLRRTIDNAQQNGVPGALLLLDLDKFKPVNDQCGHAAGDLMLREIAGLIQSQIRDRDTLARLGGDEFAVILEHCPPERGMVIANAIREAVKAYEFYCDGKLFSVGVSIGLLGMDENVPEPARAMRLADQACYAAKENGRNRVCLANDGEFQQLRAAAEMDSPRVLEEALRLDRFLLFGQRMQALGEDGEHAADCVEVLVRLCSRNGQLMKPEAFLPAAERYDLMPAIDLWVVENVLKLLHRQPEAYASFELCTINLSAQTLADDGAMQQLLDMLRRAPLAAAKLGFEITEAVALKNMLQTERVARELSAAGCRVVLEDVGTSLVSYRQLKRLPVDYLKIEGSFIQGLGDAPEDREIVRSLNDVCHLLGKRTIAKCVNEPGVLEDLRSMGVDFAQGFLVAPPQGLEQALAHRG